MCAHLQYIKHQLPIKHLHNCFPWNLAFFLNSSLSLGRTHHETYRIRSFYCPEFHSVNNHYLLAFPQSPVRGSAMQWPGTCACVVSACVRIVMCEEEKVRTTLISFEVPMQRRVPLLYPLPALGAGRNVNLCHNGGYRAFSPPGFNSRCLTT